MASTFVVGGTGYIGSALAERLASEGNEVRGLAHTPEAEAELAKRGYHPVPGTLADIDVLRKAVTDADAVVWTVMSLNPADYPGMVAALGAINDALAGTGKPLLYMGAGMVYADTGEGKVAEDGAIDVNNPAAGPLLQLEGAALAGASQGVRTLAIRSSLVYGRGAGMFVRGPIEAARAKGEAMYVGDGSTRMSTVHIDDLVDLLVRALRDGPPGTTFNAAGGDPVTTIELARGTAQAAGIDKVTSIPPEKAYEALGFMGMIMSKNLCLNVDRAHDLVGWTAKQPSVLDDLATGSYATH